MAIIYSYPTVEPKLIDKILITQSYNVDDEEPIEGNPTKSVKISSIGQLLGTTGTANTIPMFSTTGFKDSPIYTVPGSEGITVRNKITVPKINFGYNAYYGRDMFISGINEGPFDGIQVTNEFVIGKEVDTTGDIAMYFKYGDERVGGIFLDDDTSQQGLVFYVQESATNANIVKKISLREGTTIGSALASTLPPANGLAVQGAITAASISAPNGTFAGQLQVEGGLYLEGLLNSQDGITVSQSNITINDGNLVTNGNVLGVNGNFSGSLSTTGDLVSGGGVRMADVTDAASSANAGMLKYRISGNNSYVDMCMQTGAATYAWINIKQNNW
jgi:cytoskeletal protein CcmA (bactofilin family)